MLYPAELRRQTREGTYLTHRIAARARNHAKKMAAMTIMAAKTQKLKEPSERECVSDRLTQENDARKHLPFEPFQECTACRGNVGHVMQNTCVTQG